MPLHLLAALFFSFLCFAFAVESHAANTQLVSPYLASHVDDKVDWRRWSTATLELAQHKQKPLFVSSGYLACHFCHVIKKESFEDAQVGAFINQHFVPVLIDRELKPELDAQLLQFMEAVGVSGGWPLNVIMTPDRYPFAGTLYRPRDDFLNYLTTVASEWQTDRRRWTQAAQELAKNIVAEQTVTAYSVATAQVPALHRAFVQQYQHVADVEHGGFGTAEKFPLPAQLLATLRILRLRPDATIARHLRYTLQQMANRNLRDPLDGGFFRYSTNRYWGTPHYERMLSDNALLARVYIEAADVFGEPEFDRIARAALDFIITSFLGGDGGFFASQSAVDAQGIDGGYYLWTGRELAELLPTIRTDELLAKWIRISSQENTARYLPNGRVNLSSQEIALLRKARMQRQSLRDEKKLAGWNGLVLAAFARAAERYSSERYRKTADALYQFIRSELWRGEELKRIPGGDAATLADYAYTASGLHVYAVLTGEASVAALQRVVVEQAWRRFYLDGVWRESENLSLLLPYTVYPVVLRDTELPAPSAVLITATLGHTAQPPLAIKHTTRDRAHAALLITDAKMVESPFFYATQIATLLENAKVEQ